MKKIIKAIIVDDQTTAINSLKQDVLFLFPDAIQIIGESTTIDEAVVLFKEFKPDLIFLDIDLKIGTGFDFLKQISDFSYVDYDIIFTTAFNQFAIKAIKYSAFDYLLKPIDPDELKISINRLQNEIESKATKSRIKMILDNQNTDKNVPEKTIALSTSKEIKIVKIKDIVRCQSDHNYTIFYINNGKKIMVSKTIKEFDSILSEHHFIRTHQSHLVNINYVKSYLKDEGGMLLLSTNDTIPISRRKKEEVVKILKA